MSAPSATMYFGDPAGGSVALSTSEGSRLPYVLSVSKHCCVAA